MAQLDSIRLSGTTYQIIDATAVHSLDGYWTTGETTNAITAATNALAESIAEQGYQTSGDVQNAISGKVDTTTYTAYTAATDSVISGKVDNNTYTAYTAATDSTLSNKADKSEIPSVSGYADSVQYNSSSKYVEFYHGGTGGTKVFEYDASPFLIDGMVQNVEIKDVQSGSTSSFTGFWLSENDHATYANGITSFSIETPVSNTSDSVLSIEIINETGETITGASYYDKVNFTGQDFIPSSLREYVSGNITNQNAGYADIVVTAEGWKVSWIKTRYYDDSYNGTIKVGTTTTVTCLVITFNTDAGKQDINIPISEIFDASNYYTKSDTDSAISAATSGKVDTDTYTAYTASTDTVIGGKASQSDLDSVSGAVTAHTADTTIHVTSSDKTTWSGKQDALVSGTNIKTINNESVLGSGNITIDTGNKVEVSGTTLVFL